MIPVLVLMVPPAVNGPQAMALARGDVARRFGGRLLSAGAFDEPARSGWSGRFRERPSVRLRVPDGFYLRSDKDSGTKTGQMVSVSEAGGSGARGSSEGISRRL